MDPQEVISFRLGERAAFEPPPEPGQTGRIKTTLVSWWNHLICDTCGHTFRRGDWVSHDADTSAVAHLDPALGCAADPDASAAKPADAESNEFADGMAETWPPAGGVPVTRLAHGDWRTVKPRSPLERDRCLYCAHTFRAGEQVVVCPCDPASPVCGAAVHRDPAVGLACWEGWQPTGQVRLCPVTSGRPVRRTP